MMSDDENEFLHAIEEAIERRVNNLHGDHASLIKFVDERISKSEARTYTLLGVIVTLIISAAGWSLNKGMDKIREIEQDILIPLTEARTSQKLIVSDVSHVSALVDELLSAGVERFTNLETRVDTLYGDYMVHKQETREKTFEWREHLVVNARFQQEVKDHIAEDEKRDARDEARMEKHLLDMEKHD